MISWCGWIKNPSFDVQLAAFSLSESSDHNSNHGHNLCNIRSDSILINDIYTSSVAKKRKEKRRCFFLCFALFCFHCICFWSTWALRYFQHVPTVSLQLLLNNNNNYYYNKSYINHIYGLQENLGIKDFNINVVSTKSSCDVLFLFDKMYECEERNVFI